LHVLLVERLKSAMTDGSESDDYDSLLAAVASGEIEALEREFEEAGRVIEAALVVAEHDPYLLETRGAVHEGQGRVEEPRSAAW
jgi:Flp pilus assembly protein TadD